MRRLRLPSWRIAKRFVNRGKGERPQEDRQQSPAERLQRGRRWVKRVPQPPDFLARHSWTRNADALLSALTVPAMGASARVGVFKPASHSAKQKNCPNWRPHTGKHDADHDQQPSVWRDRSYA